MTEDSRGSASGPSPEALRAASGTTDDLVVVLGSGGRLRSANDRVRELTGRESDALAGTTLDALVAEADAERVRAAVDEAGTTGTAAVTAAVTAADGQRVPFEFRINALPGDGEGGRGDLVAVGREVSGREDRDRDRGRGTEAILDRMTSAFFAVDGDWTITYANERARAILSEAMADDPAPGTLEGRQLWESIPEARDTVFYERYHDAMATQETVSFEAYYPPMERWFEVTVYPSASGLSVYFDDVTERRRGRERLEARERTLRALHDIIADPGRSFTEQVEAMLALGRDELGAAYGTLSQVRGDEYVFEIVDAADDRVEAGDVVPLSATNCERVASTEETVVLGDVARDAPEATDRAGYAEWGIACYIGAPVTVEGAVYGTLCFYDTEPRADQFSDWEVTLVDLMSRWVSYELERRQATDRLQRQNDRLEEFASVVSHDLRNPLNVLYGALELAEETGDPEQFERCFRAAERIETLIDDLLTLARTGQGIDDTEPVALGGLVEECWGTVATDGATLRVLDGARRQIEADRSRLKQLLENLFRNAVEHGGPDVTITVGDLESDRGFYVADDGPGIPADERDRVFEAGYSTSDEGTGFGLRIVAEIAAAHGWDVRVTDGDDGGARFEFTGVTPAA